MATIVDDGNPYYSWVGSWANDHPADDKTPSYSNGTFHSSQKNGEYCIIKWKGRDITVFGARRNNHGIYGVSVDHGPVQYYSGYSSTDQFQQALYATSGLADGEHEIKLSNDNARNVGQYPDYIWFDIDHVAVMGSLLNANADTPTTSSAAPPPPPAPVTSTAQPQPTSSLSSSSAAPSPPPPSSSSSPPPPPPPSSSSATTSTTLSSAQATSSTSASSAISSSLTRSSVLSSAVTSSAVGLGTIGQYSNTSPATSTSMILESSSPPVPVASGSAEEGTESNKTTVMAVSVTIIVVAVVVIATILGLWWWRRKRRQREEAEDEGRDYLTPRASWR